MELGRGFTAARQQASRLAGLVWFPCLLNRKGRHSATGLMARYQGQREIKITLAFLRCKNTQATSKHLNPQGGCLPTADCGKKKISPFIHATKSPNPHRSIPTCKGCVCPTPTAPGQSGDRQRREKALPFLKEEKSEHKRARTSMLTVQPCCARHCELPLSKMGNKGLFPGVAVPLAFFCTLFFRHRKKSVSAPWDGKSLSAPESARQAPHWDLLTAKLSPIDAMQGGFPLAPLHPLRTVVG